MKNFITKLLFIAICAFTTNALSQTTVTGFKKTYTQTIDSLLLNINKQPITTGILYDRVATFAGLNDLKVNGKITTSSYDNYIQSWSELYRSAYNPTFMNLSILKTAISNNSNPNLVDIGVINTKMNYINYGTPTQQTMNFINGRFVNIAGVNPFLEKQITIIAPLKERVNSGNVTFRLLSTLILQQTGIPIKNLVANFGTGTNYNLITNQVISTTNPIVSFTTSGTKEFTFTVTFTDNSVETLKATMYIQVVPNTSLMPSAVASFPLEEDFIGTAGITTTSTGNNAFQGYNETTPSKGVLEYRTYYNKVTNNGSVASKIKKEIIILDGFDPGDGRKIHSQSIGFDPDKSCLYDSMYYDPDNNPYTNNNFNLVEILRSAPYGFDVTLVNFPNGADYIERNAMAVVSLLQRENQKLATNGSSEKISIIGPSMGGLISRYALAYMEKNGMNHNTKLWVSFDSPHLGANIPISLQETLYFYGYYGDKEKARKKFDENFRSPAARQMLIEQLDGVQQEAPYSANLFFTTMNGQNDNTRFRNLFKSSLTVNGTPNSNGFPQNLRKIALLNGTSNGTKTNSEGQMCLELAAFKYRIKVATIEANFLNTPNVFSQTFAGKITIPNKIGQIFGTEIFGLPTVIEGTMKRTNINQKGTMDIVQGGTFGTMDIIQTEFSKELEGTVASYEWRKNLHNHSFIPSVSALAFKNSNFNWSTPFNRNLVCDPANKEIPFDSYFIPPTNEDHVKVTAENANWLINELTDNPQAPYFPIPANTLTGPDLVCTTANSFFSLGSLCKIPSPAVWTVTPPTALQIISQNGTDLTVKGLGNGPATITAKFQNGMKVDKTLWVGKPSFALEHYYFEPQPVKSTLCASSDIPNFTLAQQGVTNIIFKRGTTILPNYLTYCHRTTFPECIEVTAINNCGSTTVKYQCEFLRTAQNTNIYSIYPNPSKDIVNIELRNQENQPQKDAKISGQLFDMMGQPKTKVQINNNQATFSVQGLRKGIYILKIYINDQTETHQIAVE